jgi:transposase
MGDRSTIEWTEATWNPVTGCDRVSPGCDHCYALTLAARLKAMGSPKYQEDGDPRTSGPGFGVTLHPDELAVPRRWRRPRHVFVNSMSDLFHPRVPVGFIADVFAVMAETPQHTYQVLTKRPKTSFRSFGVGLAGSLAMTTLAEDLVPDELWALVEPLLPAPPRPPYGGRHRTISDRACFAAVVYMARTSTPWRLLPARELGCGSAATCWRRLTEWAKAGVFDALHLQVLDRLGE